MSGLAPKLRFSGFEGAWLEKAIGQRLSKVIDYRGKAPPKVETGVPLITARNVRKGFLDFAVDEYIDENLYNSWMNRGLPEVNDVLFTTEAPLGNVALYPAVGKYALGQRIITLQPDKSKLNSLFLFQYLLGPIGQDAIDKRGTGSTAKGIKSKVFVTIPMAAPSLPEQQKIADFLSSIDAKVDAVKRKLDAFERYKKGLMHQIFAQKIRFKQDDGSEFPEWEVVVLKTLSKVYDGTHQTPNYVEEGVPFYSVEHLTSNNFNNTKFISEEVYQKECKRVVLEKGDVLMTRIGDIGTSKFVDWDVRASFYVSLALLKFDIKKCSSLFMHFMISTEIFQKELHKRTIHVAFPRKINLGEIGECHVKIPTLPEQQKIADFLSAVDAKIDAVTTQVQKLEAFKKGLLQQMFV